MKNGVQKGPKQSQTNKPGNPTGKVSWVCNLEHVKVELKGFIGNPSCSVLLFLSSFNMGF